jgi:hypothetical protein
MRIGFLRETVSFASTRGIGGFLAFSDSAVVQKTFVGQKKLFLFAVPARYGH